MSLSATKPMSPFARQHRLAGLHYSHVLSSGQEGTQTLLAGWLPSSYYRQATEGNTEGIKPPASYSAPPALAMLFFAAQSTLLVKDSFKQ